MREKPGGNDNPQAVGKLPLTPGCGAPPALRPDRALAWNIADLLRPRKELLTLHMEYLARMSLYDQQSVSHQLEYGLTCIKACRVREGLFEIAEARAKAEKSGRNAAFSARLKALSPVKRDWDKTL
jgi:hypothetical protein